MRLAFYFLALFGFLCPTTLAQRSAPVIDGQFQDWSAPQLSLQDAANDASGAIDLLEVQAITLGTRVWLCITITDALNLQSGPEDEGSLRLDLTLAENKQLQMDFRRRTVTSVNNGTRTALHWNDIDFSCLPTVASKQFEIELELAKFGMKAGDDIQASFSGSDELNQQLQLELLAKPNRQESPSTSHVKALASEDGATRVASINTLNMGLTDPKRSGDFAKLFQFAKADVFCFNEEWEEANFEKGVTKLFGDALPCQWNNGCGIVSKHPMQELDFDSENCSAALVNLPGQSSLVVVSVHWKCCGYAGNPQDLKRISQAESLVRSLDRLRNGVFGELAARSPVVVLGDFNLVGSRVPLKRLEESGFATVHLPSPLNGSTTTWQAVRAEDMFWPGQLDYAVISAPFSSGTSGYSIHSSELNILEPSLSITSPVSDHDMLVVDVKLD